MWGPCNDLTAHDAAYVAVAEALERALVTGDVRLAAAHGPRREVRVVW